MDFIYDNRPKVLSLQSLATTMVIQNILEDKGMLLNCPRDQKTIASRVIEVVSNLPLPSTLKWQLRPMVRPIMEEMRSWYQYKNKETQVVLKQNGTVDQPTTIRNMLNNKNASLMKRFKVACEYCLEQEIFDIGAQINFPTNFIRDEYDLIWSLDQLWYKIYEGNFHAKLGRKDISEDHCTQGFVLAMNMGNSAGVKYFVEGASPSEIGAHIHARSFTPEISIKMFKRLNEDERQRLKSRFSAQLLQALLEWPYQHQFLKAAESLAKNMDSECFWLVAVTIVEKARDGWEDHNYKGLFINFWKLGSAPQKSYIQPVGNAMDLMYHVVLMRDKQLTQFVLDNTSEEFKTQHIFNFGDSSICLLLIFDKRFEALELLMEVCKVNNNNLMVKFKKDILEYLDHGGIVLCNFYQPRFGFANEKELKNILIEFLSGMDKLKP